MNVRCVQEPTRMVIPMGENGHSSGGIAQLEGNVKCPECGYWGDEYAEEENLTGQTVLECPECGWWQ